MPIKSTVDISQNLVAFSEYMNFINFYKAIKLNSHKISEKNWLMRWKLFAYPYAYAWLCPGSVHWLCTTYIYANGNIVNLLQILLTYSKFTLLLLNKQIAVMKKLTPKKKTRWRVRKTKNTPKKLASSQMLWRK